MFTSVDSSFWAEQNNTICFVVACMVVEVCVCVHLASYPGSQLSGWCSSKDRPWYALHAYAPNVTIWWLHHRLLETIADSRGSSYSRCRHAVVFLHIIFGNVTDLENGVLWKDILLLQRTTCTCVWQHGQRSSCAFLGYVTKLVSVSRNYRIYSVWQ